MKSRKFWIAAIALVAAGIALVTLVGEYREESRRAAFVYRCNEEGAGGMITSREYCEELYARSIAKRSPAQNSN